MTEDNEFAEAARARKVNKIATFVHTSVRRNATAACKEDELLIWRVEQGARLGRILRTLRGEEGTERAMALRAQLLRETGIKAASPRTWKLLNQRLAEDYDILAAQLCSTDEVFDERGTR